MTRPVIFKPAAVAEMLQAHDWYEQREAGLGDEFLRCVDACIALLQRNVPIRCSAFDVEC